MEGKHLSPYPRVSPTLLKDELSKKVVLITGGGYGIGLAVAEAFVAANVAEIILVGRTESKLRQAVEDLGKSGNTKLSYHTVDVTSKKDVQRLFDTLKSTPDILINNAGFLASPSNFVDADLDEYWESFTVNVYGTAVVTQSFLKQRRRAQASEPAVVVTLNTIGAYSFRIPGLSSYGASKAAAARWSELVAVDVPESEARFVSVHPGLVKTQMSAKSGLEGTHPDTDPKLAASFIAWLTSQEASFLAGRFAWVNWDVDELVAKKNEILEKDLFRTSISG